MSDGRTFARERKFVGPEHAKTLKRLSRERDQFVADLRVLGGPSRGHPTASWGETLREIARGIWVTAAGPNSGDAIASCRHSNTRTEARYEATMRSPWPDEMHQVLAVQRGRLRDEADELNRLQF